ncbi:MAG: hypothetical protein ACYC0V_13715 [Armatimonadota bacterium]
MEVINQITDKREKLMINLEDQISKGEYDIKGVAIAEMIICRMRAEKIFMNKDSK